MLVRVEHTDGEWSATDLQYVPTWVDRHRGHVILSTMEWDVSDHRHSAWLERSAARVGRSLQLDHAGLSVAEACRWMGADCAPVILGAE